MEKLTSKINKYWQIIIAIVLVIFNVGYTVARLEEKPSREEVSKEIKTAINEHNLETKDNYIKIDQVPGLNQQLNSIYLQLETLNKKIDKIEDRFIYKNH